MDKLDKTALLMINPVAGRKTIQQHIGEIVRIFMDAGYLVTSMVTAERGEATELVRERGQDYSIIACAGGDGTFHEVLQGMAQADIRTPLGYIPCGTTNDFAHSYGIATDIPTAAKNIVSGKRRVCDIGRYGSMYFSYLACFGAFTWMGYTTDQNLKNRLGYTAYVLEGVRDLSKIKPIHMKLTLDGVPFEDDYLFGAVANTASIVGIIELPDSMVDTADGIFEVVLIRAPKTILELELVIRKILAQDYENCPFIEIHHAREVLVENAPDLIWSLDGENSGIEKTVEIVPVPGFLTLLGA